jgi:hypothetical protein
MATGWSVAGVSLVADLRADSSKHPILEAGRIFEIILKGGRPRAHAFDRTVTVAPISACRQRRTEGNGQNAG